jgi:peptide/nickel transport system permease protein
MAGSILGFSLPTFWVGLMLIMVFAVQLGWLPSTGRGETGTFLGITSSLHLDGLRIWRCRRSTWRCSRSALVIRLTRAGVRENDADGLREVRPRQGPVDAPRGLRARASRTS